MAVNTPAAYGMFAGNVALPQVVQTLSQSGFDKDDICMMVSPAHPLATVVREAHIIRTESVADPATTSVIAWLMKVGAVMIPTVGFFIRSQAFLQALMEGKELTGNSKALVGLGFSEGDALRFEHQLRKTGVLVYVACSEKGSANRAVEVLRRTGARETATLQKEVAQAAVA